MNWSIRKVQISPFDDTNASERSSRLRFAGLALLLTLLLGVIIASGIYGISRNSSGVSSEVIMSPSDFEQLNHLYTKPLLLPKEDVPTISNPADTQVQVNLESSSKDAGLTGTLNVNGQSTQLGGQNTTRNTLKTEDADGSTTVDISIDSGSTGTEDSSFDLNVNSQSEVYINSEW